MSEITISSGNRLWGSFTVESLTARGRVSPRLNLQLKQRPSPVADVELLDVVLRLEFRQEVIGETRLVGESMVAGGYNNLEVSTTHRLLRYVTDSLVANTSVVSLEVWLRGRGRVRMDAARAQAGRVQMASDPPLGEWTDITIGSGSPETIQISRSEWFERVLSPIRDDSYVYLELALPTVPDELAPEWGNAVGLLHDADRAYATGDDAAVFVYLRGALDALPGAKKRIVEAVADESKREALDALLKQAGVFLHRGRHVAETGEQAGTFSVDHSDSAFALDLMRVLLSHLSLLISSERRRASVQRDDS